MNAAGNAGTPVAQANTEEEIMVAVDEAREAIKLRDALMALEKNENFRLLIHERYFKGESARLVMLKISNLNVDQQKNVDKLMCGISGLNNFFQTILSQGDQMEQALETYEKELDLVREEEL